MTLVPLGSLLKRGGWAETPWDGSGSEVLTVQQHHEAMKQVLALSDLKQVTSKSQSSSSVNRV